MPDPVNDDDLSALAAEYVLGTLEPDERTRANVLLDVDHGFRELVRVWERRLGELHLMVEPVEPDGKIWQRIKGKLGILSTEAAAPAVIRADAPHEAKPSAVKPDRVKLDPVKLDPIKPDPVRLDPVRLELIKPDVGAPDAAAPDAVSPEQRLAELIHEVDKFAETWAAEAGTKPAVAVTKPVEAEIGDADAGLPRAELGEARDAERGPPDAHVPPFLIPAAAEEWREARTQVRPGGRWRAVALLMAFVALGLGSLIAAWRFIPDRLPEQLQPTHLLNISEVPSPFVRSPAPHGTQFEE